MAALETELTIYNDNVGPKKHTNIAEMSFDYGECETHFSIDLTCGATNKKTMVCVDKNDAIMFKKWLESVIILMEE